jgi:hypothetical protein
VGLLAGRAPTGWKSRGKAGGARFPSQLLTDGGRKSCPLAAAWWSHSYHLKRYDSLIRTGFMVHRIT